MAYIFVGAVEMLATDTRYTGTQTCYQKEWHRCQ